MKILLIIFCSVAALGEQDLQQDFEYEYEYDEPGDYSFEVEETYTNEDEISNPDFQIHKHNPETHKEVEKESHKRKIIRYRYFHRKKHDEPISSPKVSSTTPYVPTPIPKYMLAKAVDQFKENESMEKSRDDYSVMPSSLLPPSSAKETSKTITFHTTPTPITKSSTEPIKIPKSNVTPSRIRKPPPVIKNASIPTRIPNIIDNRKPTVMMTSPKVKQSAITTSLRASEPSTTSTTSTTTRTTIPKSRTTSEATTEAFEFDFTTQIIPERNTVIREYESKSKSFKKTKTNIRQKIKEFVDVPRTLTFRTTESSSTSTTISTVPTTTPQPSTETTPATTTSTTTTTTTTSPTKSAIKKRKRKPGRRRKGFFNRGNANIDKMWK